MKGTRDKSFSCGLGVKNQLATQETQETWVQSLGEEDLEKGMATHSSILAWRIHAQRSLVGYCPWDRKESDKIEATLHSHKPKHYSLQKNLFFFLAWIKVFYFLLLLFFSLFYLFF